MIRLLALLLAAVCAAVPVSAQTSSVSGTVVDQSGAAVPGATVQLTGEGVNELETSGSRGDYLFEGVPPGTYRIEVLLVGFAPASSDVTATAGTVQVPPIALAVASVSDVVVVSATRGDTPLIEAPATMSVIGAETLASTPAQNYADLLRGVPGMNAIQMSARDINITSRQSTGTLANSQLVLLDGRSIYLDFFGLVLWDFVPTNLSDVRQIEVIRGPASAVWGANALTGVVNIISKSPREAQGSTVSLTTGLFSRDAGSGIGGDAGVMFGANGSTARAVNDTWSYRVSAGYFNSDPYSRPRGQIPRIPDPRDPSAFVGGATYPQDREGPLGTSFANRGTSQPKFEVRVDQETVGGRVIYAGGIAGSEGIIHSGIGPFDIQRGSTSGYGKVNYTRGSTKANFFINYIDAEAPNLLLADPVTQQALQLNFSTQTYDFEVGDARTLGGRQVLTYGGNVRRNNFNITIAPAAENRTEIGAYVQDEVFLDPFRLTIGGRVDKFGNLSDPVFSPRLAAVYMPLPDHAVRVSFNRAFRSPSVINNYLQTNIVVPTDLSALAPLLPPAFGPILAAPFALSVQAVGSGIPIGGVEQEELREESLTAYEVAYTGTFGGRTTAGIAFYVNDMDESINFSQLPNNLDPYTVANPPPGWPLPPAIIGLLQQRGIFLPRTAFAYLNVGPLRQKGVELSLDHRIGDGLTAFLNYSWQGEPTILDDPEPFPTAELAFPPTNRFNLGANYDGPRFLVSGSVNYADQAFWSDVLTSPFHGFTNDYTMVSATFGVKWTNGRVTTLVKANNLLNEDIQQHVFGDILKRSILAEVRFAIP
jgi:outer membrane receptor protein involved in Fe transport